MAIPFPSAPNLVLPQDESPGLEEWLPVTASRNAKWYYSAFHNATAMVGAGVLSLPYAMSELGWGPGVVVLVLSWVITLYTLWQMIEMHEMFEGIRFDRYHELGQAAFGRRLGLYIIVPQQLLVEVSVCIVYLVTGGYSLKHIHDIARPHQCTHISIRSFILIFASSQFALSQLNNFNSISGVSLVAVVMSVSYSTIAWVGSSQKEVREDVSYGYRRRTYAVPLDFLSALGEMTFAYAGHNVVLEIQATIPSTPEEPSKRPMWKGAVVAYIVVAICYFPVALVGYRVYGNDVDENILKQLKTPTSVVILANMLVAINLMGSYQVYAMPVFDMMESIMLRKWHFRPTKSLRVVIRCSFVGVTMGVAVGLPYFSALLSFFGGFVFAPTSYFIPCIIWIILKKPPTFSLSWWTNWLGFRLLPRRSKNPSHLSNNPRDLPRVDTFAMAMFLRRAISSRNAIEILARSSASFQSRHLSQNILLSPYLGGIDVKCENRFNPKFDFFRDCRRGFAKGRKSKDDSAGVGVEVAPDIGPAVKAAASSQMEAAIEALSRELTKLRTGRASPGMLDHIIVETGGVKMPLSHIAVVSVLDPKTLSVNPYDPDSVKEIEKAIVSSPLGLNPKLDGERLIAAIPPLTKEHMQAMCKIVTRSSEDVKQSIRRARQKALETIKKAGSSLPKDDIKRIEKDVEELTKKFIKSAEGICKSKEKELTQG